MGIPSYFSHIVSKYRKIIKSMETILHVNNLYMDCNSLIYDAVKNNPTYEKGRNKEYERELIVAVCNKIDYYVSLLKPRDRVFVAFDGVAPVAKLSQQRDRRYKSWYTGQIQRDIDGKLYKETWNTSAITPGTKFMKDLNESVVEYFLKKNGDNPASCKLEYIVSTSSVCGEGEHKIFEYMRKHPEYHNAPDVVTLVYGLDADLIMLTLNHLHITKNLYLFRDTPEFIKSLDSTLDANKDYLLDIPELAESIVKYIHNYDDVREAGENKKIVENKEMKSVDEIVQTNRIKDYIFMCFLLGNDFLPHFPAVNIRTVGIEIILNVYRETLGKTNKFLINGMKIQWKNFSEFIKNIADREDDLMIDEHKRRDKMAKRFGGSGGGGGYNNMHGRNGRNDKNQFINTNKPTILGSTDEVLGVDDIKKMDDLLMLPMKDRSVEKYINPFERDWEYRYYKALFDIEITDERRRQISVNYLEGLEWTFYYYIQGCIDWRWCYNYHYAPLFKDLVKYIPQIDTQFITPSQHKSIEDLVQLCYVLPKANLNLLPIEVNVVLFQRLEHLYGDDYEFKWAYCKYFWESHADLPRLNIETLESVVNEAKNKVSFATSLPINIPLPKSPMYDKRVSPSSSASNGMKELKV
jgi:5'-3' exoribonuclease 2